MIIGERLKKERIKRGLSQQQLGDMLGVTKVSICGYETGTRTPTLETFLDILKILDLTPDYLLGRDIDAVNEQGENYSVKIAKEDMEIINELKQHRELYNKLCSNPQRVINIIERRLKK